MKDARMIICPSDDNIKRAAATISTGRVIGIPTETYYGLAADPENENALSSLFALKNRPSYKPILLLISQFEQLQKYTLSIPPPFRSLINCYWPGPLTLVFPAKPDVSTLLTGGSETIGIRLTSHPITRRLIDVLGHPITATSANLSEHEPARTAQEVSSFFGDGVGCIVDGGPAGEGPGSTVVSFKKGKLCIERIGRVFLPGLPDCKELLECN